MVEKLEKRIAELRKENTTDQERLSVLETKYEEAVNNFEASKIDKLHTEITGIKSALENRGKQIEILVNPCNPIRVKAQEEMKDKAVSKLNLAKEKADSLNTELLKAQSSYIDLANQIFEVNQEVNLVSRQYKHVAGDADSLPPGPYLQPQQYGVSIGTDRDNKNIHFQGGIYK